MTFAHPILLAIGLGCVALPIVIHILMRRRRRPVRWAAMRFLIEAYKRQRQRVRLEQLLLLAARCLIVLLAAMAIARPMVPGADPLLGSRATTLHLVIDNSLTAGQGSPGALERHRERALELIERLDPARGDRVAVHALAGPSSAVVAPATSTLATAAQRVAVLEGADSRGDLAGALTRIAGEIAQERAGGSGDDRVVVAVLSEFRAGLGSLERGLPSLGEARDLVLAATVPAADVVDNVAITGVEPLRPIVLGQGDVSTTQVRVRAARFGAVGGAARVDVELVVRRASQVARATPALASGTLVFEAGEREASVALGIDIAAAAALVGEVRGPIVVEARLGRGDALARDDVRRGVIDRRESLEVGVVAPPRFGPRPGVADYRAFDWVEAALDPEGRREGGEIRVEAIPPGGVDASGLAGLQAVVVAEPQGVGDEGWRALRRFADLGGLVVLMPQPGEGAQVWTDAAMGAFGLDWTLAREAEVVGGDAGAAVVRPESVSGLLALVEGEMGDLLRPVGVRRAMPVAADELGTGEALLALEDGRVLALATRVGGAGGEDGESGERGSGVSRGLVVYVGVAMDLAWSDLPTKPLMIPLLQEVVRQGVASARGGWRIEAGEVAVA
ncbi:MAG: BatA domain-containing protein, partial [Phycisphaerales bacterium]|nr:BatA domain-containing protein [Phycisphaerales bacterium]